ncbi:cytochrome c maturation protein CcmE [Aurantivibrio infirmus]
MHPVRKQRLIFVLFIVLFAGSAAGLVTYALRDNISLFYAPSKIVGAEIPTDRIIRAGGCVVPGSLVRTPNSFHKRFTITDGIANLIVDTEETLPDLFAEGEDVVLTGKMNDSGHLVATEVLAKHDENYTPPEIADTVQSEGKYQKVCEGLDYGS